MSGRRKSSQRWERRTWCRREKRGRRCCGRGSAQAGEISSGVTPVIDPLIALSSSLEPPHAQGTRERLEESERSEESMGERGRTCAGLYASSESVRMSTSGF
jgi:hypothetical protein